MTLVMKSSLKITPSDYRKLSDEELIRRYLELHEYSSVNYIFERYGHIVFGMCLKRSRTPEAAKQLTEEMFVKIIGEVASKPVRDFKRWLYNYITAYDGNPAVSGTNNGSPAAHHKHTGEPIISDYGEHALRKALDELPASQRQCIKLFYVDCKCHDEVASETGNQVNRTKELLQHGMLQLREKLERG
jgi:DNA-directed RNA polymerase specialized sigma24 family protein